VYCNNLVLQTKTNSEIKEKIAELHFFEKKSLKYLHIWDFFCNFVADFVRNASSAHVYEYVTRIKL